MVLQSQIEQKGLAIFAAADKAKGPGIFNKDWWNGRIMEWSMKNPSFKVQMFRFVDVLPYLTDGSDVLSHLKEYFESPEGDVPAVFKMGVSGLTNFGIGKNFVADQIRKNVTSMASMFIVGADAHSAMPVLAKLRQERLCFTVDLLGEAAVAENEALDYQTRYKALLAKLLVEQKNWKEDPLLDRAPWGEVSKVNISVKISALFSQTNGAAPDHSVEVLKQRLKPLLDIAKEGGAFVNFDMENYGIKDLTLQLFREVLLDYPGWDGLGLVIQAYLKDSARDLEEMISFAKKHKRTITVRLVKGAYWDSEIIWAKDKGWPIPVFEKKTHTDANYELLSSMMIDAYPTVRPAFGTHNVRSMAAAICLAEKKGLPPSAIEFQALFGMAEPFKRALTDMGYRVRDYAPVGELIPGMAYLVRRLLENTSNEGFLKQKFEDGRDSTSLLAAPQAYREEKPPLPKHIEDPLYFKNEPFWDFGIQEIRTQYLQALKSLELPVLAQPVIGNTPKWGEVAFKRVNPSATQQVVSQSVWATTDDVYKAVDSAKSALSGWGQRTDHGALLHQLADFISADRARLTALITLEVGKSPKEADADVAEAIDFCRYYADRSCELDPKAVSFVPGEQSFYHYQARGVVAVIAPWNFPLAILTGMAVAALVTKNTVIIKPAEQSAGVGQALMNLIQKLRLPSGVVSFLPGDGEIVGKALVEHPDVAMICFTGSKAVGMQINSAAASASKLGVKKVIAEMGGKNAIIVDSDADMDEAVLGIVHSAFGFQGQKCSACSRVIVVKGNDDRLIARLKEATHSLLMGPATDLRYAMGPVVDKESFDRIKGIIDQAKTRKGVRLIYEGNPAGLEGYYVPPTIFEVENPDDFLMREEVFGPVLAIYRVQDIDQAIAVANDVPYALTGGVYSRKPSHIEKVRVGLQVGNCYINRSITGALVGRHPFGGFKLSGMGSKAGGPDYLLQFVEPRVWTENTTRRGFTPELLS